MSLFCAQHLFVYIVSTAVDRKAGNEPGDAGVVQQGRVDILCRFWLKTKGMKTRCMGVGIKNTHRSSWRLCTDIMNRFVRYIGTDFVYVFFGNSDPLHPMARRLAIVIYRANWWIARQKERTKCIALSKKKMRWILLYAGRLLLTFFLLSTEEKQQRENKRGAAFTALYRHTR